MSAVSGTPCPTRSHAGGVQRDLLEAEEDIDNEEEVFIHKDKLLTARRPRAVSVSIKITNNN